MDLVKNLYVSCDGPGWVNWCVLTCCTFRNDAWAADYMAWNVELLSEMLSYLVKCW